jgi:hypothetical protein
LQDAGTYITKLPKAEHEAPEWQTAIEMLINAAERGGGWRMFARIGVMRALLRDEPKGAPAPRQGLQGRSVMPLQLRCVLAGMND